MLAKQLNIVVDDNRRLKQDVYLLSFNSPYLAKNSSPGMFLHIKVNPAILRRPFSVHNVKGDKAYVLFRVRGRGTTVLARYKKGDKLSVIGPLGNGFVIRRTKDEGREMNLLIAGGIGVAPLLFLAERLSRESNSKTKNVVLLGSKSKKDILCEQEFKNLGFKVLVATEDGSCGTKGTPIDLLQTTNYKLQTTNLYACGPKEMFAAMSRVLKTRPDINCQVSFEQFMGCGLGVCCGCAIETKQGYKKVCKDGPVFDLRDIY